MLSLGGSIHPPGDFVAAVAFGGDALWYRREFAVGKFEFIFVDPSKGIRRTAFNHKTLATLMDGLERQTVQKTNPDSLPFAWIDLAPDSSWICFRFNHKMWQCGPEDKLKAWEGDLNEGKLLPLSKELPSAHTGNETSVTFINYAETPLSVLWIDWDRKAVPYGTVEVGKFKSHSTYVGHVRRLVDKVSGKTKAIYSAVEEDTTAVIDDSTLDDIASQGNEMALEGESKSKDLSKLDAAAVLWLDSRHPFAISTSWSARQKMEKHRSQPVVLKRTHTTKHVFSSRPMEGLQWYGNIALCKTIQ